MKKQILLVEDNERLRSNLLFVLNKEGFQATGAVNGSEALQEITKKIPDLIISDIMMPDMDGYELVKHLRESSETLDIPVIFLTAKATNEELRSGMLHGVNDYLTKPVNINDLLTTINVRLEFAEKQKKKWIANLHHLQKHLTSILPHELRTPLSGILGASSLLRTNLEELTPNDILEMYGCIELSARRLERVAENFLLYVQLQLLLEERSVLHNETHNGKAQYQITIIKEHIEDIANLCAQRHNRAQDIQCSVHETSIRCSVAHFTKMIYEVIDNALQFSPRNTPVEVVSETEGNIIIIRVTNAGQGLTTEQLRTIQEFPTVFKQFDRNKFEQQGIGMGLVLVYTILQLYGGQMNITSEPGRSTTVELIFPVIRQN